MIKNINTKKVATALFFIVAGVVFLNASFAERGLLLAVDEGLDPMLYPRCLIIGWLASSILYLIMPQERFQASALKKFLPILASVVAVIGVYIFLFAYFGLVVSTFIFMILFAVVMGNRKVVQNLIFASVFTFVTWLVFEVALGIPMPGNIIMETFF